MPDGPPVSRRPHRQANRLPAPIEAVIVRLKRDYPGWGAPNISREAAAAVALRVLPVSVATPTDSAGLANLFVGVS